MARRERVREFQKIGNPHPICWPPEPQSSTYSLLDLLDIETSESKLAPERKRWDYSARPPTNWKVVEIRLLVVSTRPSFLDCQRATGINKANTVLVQKPFWMFFLRLQYWCVLYMFRRVALFGKYVYVWNSSTKGLFLVSCHWVEVCFSEVINDPESSIKKTTITNFSNYERYRRIQDTFAGTIGFFSIQMSVTFVLFTWYNTP